MAKEAKSEDKDKAKVARRDLEEIGRQFKQALVPKEGNFIDEQMTELEQRIEGLCSSNKDLFALLERIDFEAIFHC